MPLYRPVGNQLLSKERLTELEITAPETLDFSERMYWKDYCSETSKSLLSQSASIKPGSGNPPYLYG